MAIRGLESRLEDISSRLESSAQQVGEQGTHGQNQNDSRTAEPFELPHFVNHYQQLRKTPR